MEDGRRRMMSVVHSLPPILHLAYGWVPVLLWMVGIFYFSSCSHPLGPLSRSEHSEIIRSIAHFVEYAGLAVLLYRALSGSWPAQEQPADPGQSGPLAGRGPFLYSFIISLLFALLDELLQGFVPGRDAELADVALDVAGIWTALLVIKRWYQLRSQGSAKGQEREEAG